jgi:enoyl-CoA hydratase
LEVYDPRIVAASYDFTHLDVEVDGDGIALVTFAPKEDPEGDLVDSIFANTRDVFAPLSLDANVRAVVLTGPGSVFFEGAGLPRTLRLIKSSHHLVGDQIQTLQQVLATLVQFRKPVVAAVGGPARNIGAQIALLSDAAVAADTATFFDDHISIGLPAGDGGTMLWPMLVGMARAREILLRGGRIDAAEALDLHLVTKVVSPAKVVGEAKAVAKALAELAPLPFFATKLALNNWWRLSSVVSFDLALAYEAGSLVQPDFVQRLEAIAESRSDA